MVDYFYVVHCRVVLYTCSGILSHNTETPVQMVFHRRSHSALFKPDWTNKQTLRTKRKKKTQSTKSTEQREHRENLTQEI